MTPQEKARATILEKYQTWENYLDIRYRSPEKAEQRKRVASIAGKASAGKPRGFSDPEVAKRAVNKRWNK